MCTYHHKCRRLLFILWLGFYLTSAWGISLGDADRIFDKAESLYPNLLNSSDNKSDTLEIPGWVYRYYPLNDLYVGIDSQEDVYSLSGDTLIRHGSVNEIKQNFGIQDCVTLGKPPANFLVPYKARFPIFEPVSKTLLDKTTYVRFDESIKEVSSESFESVTNQLTSKLSLIQNYHIQDGFIIIDSSVRSYQGSNANDAPEITTSIHSPPSLDMPYSTLCVEQKWQVPSFSQIASVTKVGQADRSFTRGIEGYPVTVKSIDAVVTSPIGDIPTVHIVEDFQEHDTIIVRNEIWYSIEYGIPVKQMSFDKNNAVHYLEELDL